MNEVEETRLAYTRLAGFVALRDVSHWCEQGCLYCLFFAPLFHRHLDAASIAYDLAVAEAHRMKGEPT